MTRLDGFCNIINDICPYNYDDCNMCHVYVVVEEAKEASRDIQCEIQYDSIRGRSVIN